MILQRQRPIPVWGKGREGITVEVELSSRRAKTTVQNGIWSVDLPALEASVNEQIKVRACNPEDGEQMELCVSNVAIGEVWIASGQSNMEFLYRYDLERIPPEEIEADEQLRFFDVPKTSYEGQLEAGHYEDYGFWRIWSGENAEWFSAVGYYFGQKLRQALKVPVGIIGCNWGGCNAAAWTSPERMNEHCETRRIVKEYQESLKTMDMEAYKKATDYITAKDPVKDRKITDQFMMGVKFADIEASRKNTQTEEERQLLAINMQVGPRSYRRPSGLYETMLKKVLPCEIRGALWYQGEEDEISRSEFYDVSLTAVINTFRDRWDHLPFLVVQLPPFEGNALALARRYPMIRHMQWKVSKTVPDVWCACTADVGERNNIHPRFKRPVGQRLGLLALKHVYQMELEADSPELIEVKRQGESVILRFDNTADGLCIRGKEPTGLLLYVEGQRLMPDIKVEKDTITLTDESLTSITGQILVKYGADNYFEVNLYNTANLPVFPFEYMIER